MPASTHFHFETVPLQFTSPRLSFSQFKVSCIEILNALEVEVESLIPIMVNLLWLIPVAISAVIFTNHYTRDAVGALEKQLEGDVPISVVQYALLNTIYFTPNIISPLFAGLAIKPLGGAERVFAYFTFFALVGSLLFAVGVQASNVPILYLGRFVSGVMYESIDTLPVILLRPLFEHRRWNLVVGMMNAALRLGSVLNFYVSPLSYGLFGLKSSFWISAAVSFVGWFAASGNLYILYTIYDEVWKKHLAATGMDKENGHNSNNKQDNTDNHKGFEMVPTDSEVSTSPIGVIDFDEESNARQMNGAAKNNHGHNHSSSSNNSSDTEGSSSGLSRYSMFATIVAHVQDTIPLSKFSASFYLYFCTVSCVYGCMVPFWFLGKLQFHTVFVL
jgi:MFS family permease